MFLLPIFTFVLFVMIDYVYRRKIFEAVADAWLAVTAYVWLTTEALSAVDRWNKWTVLFSWCAVCVILGSIVVRKKVWQRACSQLKIKDGIVEKIKEYNKYVIAFAVFVIFISIMAILRSQSLIDNLTHRLPRIMHWIQNESVRYFATSSPRQVQLSSLVEYMNAQIYLLGGCDRLANLVQVGAYICSGIMIFGISRKIGVGYKLSFISVYFYLLVPMSIIEVFTTQTDIVAGVYLLIFIYMILDFIRADKLVMDKHEMISTAKISACILAGYLSKPTVCFTMIIFFLWMCIVRLLKRDSIIELLKYVFVGGIVALILFSPSYIRNYRAYNVNVVEENIEAADVQDNAYATEGDGGEEVVVAREPNKALVIRSLTNAKSFIMCCIQNLGMNASTRCFPQMNKLIIRVVYKCARILDFLAGADFKIFVDGGGLGETNEPSPAIMLFWVLSWGAIILGCSRVKKEQFIYLFCASLGVVVQSGLMGYTFYRTRYLLGAMGVLCPAFAAAIQGIKYNNSLKQKVATALIVISMFGAVNALTYEIPYMIDGFKGEKVHQYFVNNNEPEFYYDQMARFANENKYTQVAIAGTIQYEYVLWQTIENLKRLEMVNVEDIALRKYEDNSYIPECIFVESKEEIKVKDELLCHNVKYECVWADFGNNRYYTAFIPCK